MMLWPNSSKIFDFTARAMRLSDDYTSFWAEYRFSLSLSLSLSQLSLSSVVS